MHPVAPELARLNVSLLLLHVLPAEVNRTAIVGDETEDAPAFTSGDSIVMQRFYNVTPDTIDAHTALLHVKASFLLHARYPLPAATSKRSHAEVRIGFPVATISCSWMPNSTRPALAPCTNCAGTEGSSLFWHVPRGCVDDCLIVTLTTAMLHIASAAVIGIFVLNISRKQIKYRLIRHFTEKEVKRK